MNERRPSSDVEDGGTIEGGEVSDVKDLRVFNKHHREVTARWLAKALIVMLAASALVHYLTVAVLLYLDKADVADRLGNFFNAWLPVISGLAGSATTYYLAKEKT